MLVRVPTAVPGNYRPSIVVGEEPFKKDKIYVHSTPSGLKYNPKGTVYRRVVLPFLKEHQKASYIGTTGDLYTLLSKDIPQYDLPPKLPEWDYSKPTLSESNGLDRSGKLGKIMGEKSFQTFQERLAGPDWFDAVTKFVQKTPGLIMAGGYVVKTYLSLLGHKTDSKACQDIDLFLTEPASSSPEAANKVVTDLEQVFIEYCGNFRNRSNYYSMSRTSNCVNFFLRDNYEEGGDIAQVILRRYSHPSEVLHSFDLGSCQLAYDGKEVFTTSVGLLAIKMGINIIDMTRRRRTYERRLSKYLDRGFGIVFPNLSPASLEKETIETSYFKLHGNGGYYGPTPCFSPLIYGNTFKEEYSGMVESYQIQIDTRKVQRHNVSNYIRQKSYGTKPYYLIRFGGTDISESKKICDDSIKVFYHSSRWSYYSLIIENIYTDPLNIKLQDMKDYLTPPIIKMLMNLILDAELDLRHELIVKIVKEIKTLGEEIERELPKITIPLKWRSPGDGNDLNASFGMERVPIEKWYGEHYFPLGWDETKFKYYPQEVRDSVRTVMLIRNRQVSYIRFLPMEIMFYIFGYLVSR